MSSGNVQPIAPNDGKTDRAEQTLWAALTKFVAGGDDEEEEVDDKDERAIANVRTKGAGREALVPAPFAHRADIWGGGLRRMSVGSMGPRREDEHYYSPRYVPIGYARYANPMADPADYTYYRLSGWRIAVLRSLCQDSVRDLLRRVYQYGPGSAGYVRLGDTLVPAILGPGDRRTLAGAAALNDQSSRQYPLA